MRSTRSAAAVASAIVLALAGCGGGDDGSEADASKSPSASPSSESPSATSPAPSAEALFQRVSTAAAEAGTVRTDYTSSSVAGDVSGSGVVRFGDDYAADLTVAVPGGTGVGLGEIRAVLVEETFFMQLGSEIGLPAGKTWISLTADDDNPLATSLAPLFDALTTAGDVEASFAAIEAGTELRDEGQEDVDGVATTKYVVTVDVEMALARGGPTAASWQSLKDLGVTTFDYSIWLDADDLPRRYSQDIPVSGGTASTTAMYSDWGGEVDVTAPPAEQVASLDDLVPTG